MLYRSEAFAEHDNRRMYVHFLLQVDGAIVLYSVLTFRAADSARYSKSTGEDMCMHNIPLITSFLTDEILKEVIGNDNRNSSLIHTLDITP